MTIACIIGLHNWDEDCEKCSICGNVRSNRHNWSHDCETCSVCKKRRTNKHDWSNDCQKCFICGISRSAEHNWSNNCEKCSVCGKTELDKHSWKENCEKCSICGTRRYGKHKWQRASDECSICGVLRSENVELDKNSNTLLLFHWNKFEFEGVIIYRKVGCEIKIILQSIYCDFTEMYVPTSKRIIERNLDGLTDFLEKFTQNEFWFMAKPQYIHDSIKSYFVEQIAKIDTSNLCQRDSLYLENWYKKLDYRK